MTPHEIHLVSQAKHEQINIWHRLLAWHVSFVLNMVSKKPITPAMLLGEETKKKGLPDLKKLKELAFKKSLGMDVDFSEASPDELISSDLLRKFNGVE